VEFFLWLRRTANGGPVPGTPVLGTSATGTPATGSDEAEIRRVVEAGVTAPTPMREDRDGETDGGGR